MFVQAVSPPMIFSIALERAQSFINQIPQALGAHREGKSVVLSYIADEPLPEDAGQYRKEKVDKYARQAYREILQDQDEIDLYLIDIKMIFTVLFWDGQALEELEVPYSMNELSHLTRGTA